MQRVARAASIALLVVGALAAIALIAWSIYMRQKILGPGPGRPGLRTGLELAARLGPEYLIALGAVAVAALALAFAQWSRRPIAFLIGAVWWAQRFVVRFEDPHFVKKSPWVQAATSLATVTTVYLAILAVTSLVAWLTSRRPTPAR